MGRTTRAGGAVLALALVSAAPAMAQIEGMPLFTNPRIATGIRIHADYGKQTGTNNTGVDTHVIQGGVGFVIGPVGFDASVGTTKTTISNGCVSSPTISCAGNTLTGSLLAAIKVYGGGQRNVSLALFGGGSVDFDTSDVTTGSSTPQNKLVHIPLGAALGYRVPLGGLASLNVWGAPRWNMYKFVNCSGTCPDAPKGSFGWAVGADLPIFRILSVRAAYDSHKINFPGGGSTNVNVWGVGASIGLGGMR